MYLCWNGCHLGFLCPHFNQPPQFLSLFYRQPPISRNQSISSLSLPLFLLFTIHLPRSALPQYLVVCRTILSLPLSLRIFAAFLTALFRCSFSTTILCIFSLVKNVVNSLLNNALFNQWFWCSKYAVNSLHFRQVV